MISFFTWYLFITLLGLLTFPLAWRMLPALADRGYAFSRALGLLLWGFIFWMLASLGIIQNDPGGLALAFFIVIGLSAWAVWKTIVDRKSSIVNWLKSNLRVVITTEVLFLLAFAAWAFVRASNPEITSAGGEKTMELAFINAIMRSPTFPPHDPWLSGYAISYYYFGYVMTAMLAEVTGVAGGVAHNLMLALTFALSAVGAYGVVYNLLVVWRNRQSEIENCESPAGTVSSIGLPLLGPFFLLIVSNFQGFLEVLHQRGLFWPSRPGAWNFWIWLDIKFLDQLPSRLGWIPDRFYWWWQASRVIQDVDLAGTRTEIIDEFPFFSYLLGDLHPHVLSMPFVMLAIAMALNIFLGGWDGNHNIFGFRLPLQWKGFFFAAFVLGGLAFLNTWDILAFMALVLGSFLLRRVHLHGWTWVRLEETLTLAIPLGALSLILYLPFYLGFSSQVGGILPNLVSPTRGIHLWVMFGSLFLPLFAYLIYLRRGEPGRVRWLVGFGLSAGVTFLLWLFSWVLGIVAWFKDNKFASNYLESQGASTPGQFFQLATQTRFTTLGGWLILFVVVGIAFTYLLRRPENNDIVAVDSASPPSLFVTLLILLAGLLVLAPEFVYIRDLFGNRMNTVFKFYYQGWEMWSLAVAFGVAVILEKVKAWRPTFLVILLGIMLAFAALVEGNGLLRVIEWTFAALVLPVIIFLTRPTLRGMLFHFGLACVLAMALTYSVLGLSSKTDDLKIPTFLQTLDNAKESGEPAPFKTAVRVWTLDGTALFEMQYPADALAVHWLQSAPAGVVAEAVGDSYSDYGRMAVFSGQPNVLGWPFHEYQWRGDWSVQGTRKDDLRALYETSSWDAARTIIEKYNIRYIYIGTLEHNTYRVNETKFQQNLQTVYQGNGVVIYAVP